MVTGHYDAQHSLSAVWVALFGIGVSVLWAAISSNNEPLATTLAFHPELYHGEGKTHHFFEGWYHKLVRTRIDCSNAGASHNYASGTNIDIDIDIDIDSDIDNLSMAVVPGVFYDSGNSGKNESHAFIFVTVNGEKQHYYRFDLETEFRYRKLEGKENENENDSSSSSNEQYYVEIGTNRFSKHGIRLDLFSRFGDDASIALKGAVHYEELSPWPIPSVRNLGAMGPVGYFLSPFLEC